MCVISSHTTHHPFTQYLDIRPTHHSRLVKIFARDENGISRPVCTAVQPVHAGICCAVAIT